MRTCAGLMAFGAWALVLVACSEEPEGTQVVRRAPAPPPPPPKPAVTAISDLMDELGIDPRVELPESKAPNNDADRRAILEFFDSFARGDVEALRERLSLNDQMELEKLASTDAWDETVEQIEEIELQTGSGPLGMCVLAIFTVGYDFQPQLWYYEGDGQGYTFEALATPPGIMDQLAGDDWIGQWHQMLVDEVALADAPDAEVEIQRQILAEASESGGSSGSGKPGEVEPGQPVKPTGLPPNMPGRKKPKRRRKAPGQP